jgi:hypothetical protein
VGGPAIVINKDYLERQAAALPKLSQSTKDPDIAAALIKKAADLKSQVDELCAGPDKGPQAPDVEWSA